MQSTRALFVAAATSMLLLCIQPMSWAQSDPQSPSAQAENLTQAIRELQSEVHELQQSVEELRDESKHYREEAAELHRQLQANMQTPSQFSSQNTPEGEPAADKTSQRIAKLEDDIGLLNGKVDEQHQTKVESASKYRVRLSGIVLFNLAGNRGSVDSIDIPSFATYSSRAGSAGTFGGTLRQSLLGLEAFGPDFAGARTSANIQFDFAGGFAPTINGVTAGLARLRTGVVRLDWPKITIVAGQDSVFIAPQLPTSFASFALPPLAYAGHLWTWTPQVRIERRFSLPDDSAISVQAGVLDPLTGGPPAYGYDRLPSAGEKSGQPAYAMHVGWSKKTSTQALQLGVGGYYDRQDWGFDRSVDAWAATADWNVPLGRLFQLSGELYRGRGIGGLGAASGESVIFRGPLSSPGTRIRALNSVGGWAQLKFSPASRIEFNGAFGQDNPYAADLWYLPGGTTSYSGLPLARNRTWFVNAIARPRSDLIFSLEYRRIMSSQLLQDSMAADHLNLGIGLLF